MLKSFCLVIKILKCKQRDEIRLDKEEIEEPFLRNLGQVTYKKPWLSNLQKKNGISYASMWWAFFIKTFQVSLCKKNRTCGSRNLKIVL